MHGQVGEVHEDLAAILARVPPGDHTALGPHTRLHPRRGGQPWPRQPRDLRRVRDPGALSLRGQPRVVVHHPFELQQSHRELQGQQALFCVIVAVFRLLFIVINISFIFIHELFVFVVFFDVFRDFP